MNSSRNELINQMLYNLKTSLKAVNTAYCDTSWCGKNTIFSYDSIGYILEGSIYLKIGNIEVTPYKGCMYFLPANTSQSFKIHQCNEAILHWCHFESSIGIQNLFDLIKFPLVKEATDTFYINKLFKEMMHSWHSNHIGMPLKANALLMEIIYYYLSLLSVEEIDVKNAEVSSAMNEVLDYIDKNLNNNTTVNTLASIAGLNSNYFIEIFKKYFNITPIQYILNKKEEAAKKMLMCTEMSIKEIGDHLGFSNQNYFSEFFKKRTGYSPVIFRKMNINNVSMAMHTKSL